MTFGGHGCSVRRIGEGVDTIQGRPFWRAGLGWLAMLVPGFIRRFFRDRFGDVSRSECWGYVVWGAMGIVIAVPELLAAAGGNNFLWPTISTTVGHLQDRWPVLTLIPVALIVMAGYSALRFKLGDTTVQADLQAIGRTPQGRLVKQDVQFDQLAQGGVPPEPPRRGEWPVLPYFTFATAVVVAGGVVAAPSDSRFLVGYVLYSLIALFWVVIPNAASYFFGKDFPFTTLVFTVGALGRRLQFAAAFVAALLVILLLHLAFYPWPSRR
jgi:hypothetical protein